VNVLAVAQPQRRAWLALTLHGWAQVRPDCWFVHHDVAASVDAMLAGQHPEVEVRTLDHLGRVVKTPLEYAEEPAAVPRFEVSAPHVERGCNTKRVPIRRLAVRRGSG
jgi:hypothetical protein